MIEYNNKRIGRRAPINLEKLDKPFLVIYNTPFHGTMVRQLLVNTREEADRLVEKANKSSKTYPLEYVIDLREALAEPIKRINDSRR